jgi:ribosomal protein S18 acetylase RimI-like enzyme
MLMNKLIEHAKEGKHDLIWLGVWPNNHRAIKFYEKFGFTKVGEHSFPVGETMDTDDIMALYLN